MQKNNLFEHYGNSVIEVGIVEKWLRESKYIDLLSNQFKMKYYKICKIQDTQVGYDVEVEFVNLEEQNSFKITIEVKIESDMWYQKTGNIGLDYISAFEFKKPEYKEKIKENRYWIKKEKIEGFRNNVINVMKYGKLFECKADIQLFYCKLNDNEADIFAYYNECLKNLRYYFEKNYNLRINDKKTYKLSDNWESAAFFVNPKKDEKLKLCQIDNIEKFLKYLKLKLLY